MKPLPLIVSVSGLLPAGTEDGDRLVIAGWGLLAACTLKLNGGEVPPLGPGLVTVIGKVPPVVRSPAGSIAVILLVLTKTDGRAALLKLSVAPGAKFAPVRVNVTPELPAATESGVMLVMDGVVSEGRKPPEARPMGKESWSCCMRSSGQSSPPPMPKMSSATLQAESSTPPESVHHGLAEKSTPSWRNASVKPTA